MIPKSGDRFSDKIMLKQISDALDPGVGDHLGPARDVLGDQRLELLRRACLRLAAHGVDTFDRGGLGDQRVDLPIEARRDLRGSLAGPTMPIHEVTENPGKPASAMEPTSGSGA